ncbi:Transcription factor TFIID complex subunit 8 c-term domain-containing protein [Ceratobasidium theobromae]|uniref:Transcription factor TFIID complex subunit 8 c-term domain-containing protein n=1 Tax=Ceratobasidium theobromae TaxID=1582974 RepID=A0A5N5QP05_9AGAM|nr:Transcription factor TFIID complex subunit 8 c-term domain-containing protein [Ceratobasidium theobromae]
MANASAKKVAAQNEVAIRNLQIGMLIANVLYWVLRFFFRGPVLARGPTTLYILTFIPTAVLYRHLTSIGLPRKEPKTGALISPGEDLNQSGITEWCWDIIYVTWGCAVGSSLLGNWVWWLYLVIPGYAGFKVYTKFVGPMFFNKGASASAEGDAADGPSGPSKRQQKLQQRAEKGDPPKLIQLVKSEPMADQTYSLEDSPTRNSHNKDRNGAQSAPTGITITEPIASQCIQRLIQIQLRVAGFKGANRGAMDAIEKEVINTRADLNDTYELAVALANNSGRSRPAAQDVLKACEDGNLTAQDLKRVMRRTRKVSRSTVPMFKPAPKRRRSPELLGSDESSAGEDNGDQSRTEKSKDSSNKPRTLKHLPNQLPDLPPKHSYMRTATPSAPKPSLNVLDQQLERTMLVQESLQNIVKATGSDGGLPTPQPDPTISLLSEVPAAKTMRVCCCWAAARVSERSIGHVTMSSAPRTPIRKAHPTSPSKSVFAPNITKGTAQARFKSNIAALSALFALHFFAPGLIELALATTKLCASVLTPVFGDQFGPKFSSFVEISIPLVLVWNTIEAAYRIQWPAIYPASPPTPGPFSTPLSPAQRRLRGLTPKPSRPPTFPAPVLPPSPLRSPTHPPLDQSVSELGLLTSPSKSVSAEKNPFLASTPFMPARSNGASNPFLSVSHGPRGPLPRDQASLFSDGSPVAAFNGKHSVGPGNSSMVASFVSELDR